MSPLAKLLLHFFFAGLLLGQLPLIDARCGSWRGRSKCCKCPATPPADPEPPTDCDPKCPSAHAVEQQCNGRRYKLFCGIHVATNPLYANKHPYAVADYGVCFNDCANDPNCGAFDYSKGNCWLKATGVDPPPKQMADGENSVIFLDKTQ